MNNTKKILCTIFIGVSATILLIPFLCNLLLASLEYSIFSGLTGSEWVGVENIIKFFQSPRFIPIISDTFVIGFMGTIIGVAYTFLSSLAIGSVKNKISRGLIAALFAIPAVVPANLFADIISTEYIMNSPIILKLCVAWVDGLRLAGLFSLMAFFMEGDALKCSVKCMLVFVGIRLISMFSTDLIAINGVYNFETSEAVDTFTRYSYDTGIIQSRYSYAAAVHIVKVFMQVVPAVFGCIIFGFVSKINAGNKLQEKNNIRFSPALAFLIIPVVILLVVIITGGSLLPTTSHPMVSTGYTSGLIISCISAMLVAAASLGLAVLARNSAKGIGVVILAVLCLTGNGFVGNYIMMCIPFELSDSYLGVILGNFGIISVVALIMTFATCNNRSVRKDLSVLISGLMLMFARFWGDYFWSSLMLRNAEKKPMSMILQEITINNMALYEGKLFSTMPYIMIPLVLVLAGFIVSAALKKD